MSTTPRDAAWLKGTISAWPAAGQTCAAPTSANGFSLAGAAAALYLRGLHGDQDTELDGSGNWRHTNVFAGGGLTATYDAGVTPAARPRSALVTPTGSAPAACRPAAPRSDSALLGLRPVWQLLLAHATGDDATEHHFTGKERDTESGQRLLRGTVLRSAMGRFMSPDWSAKEEPVPYAKLDDPQT